ncbi:MAG: DUF2807 domain-containing protein [Prevotella sp.]|nr:DUF2807 domain-containing protein [Prevotella sp.]
MKKSVLALASVVIALSSCSINVNGLNKIKPSDNIVKKEYKLDKFNEVTTHVVGNIKLIQSEEKDGLVELSAPENYIELFSIKSKGEKLEISYAKNNLNLEGKNVNITVYTSDLLKIKNSGVASISLDSLDTDELDVENSGVGTIKLNKIQADKISVKCSGVGDIAIDGVTQEADLTCSGVGNIKAQGLKANKANANVSGVGGITCYASEYLDGKVTGVGSLRYDGHPKEKKLNKPGFTGNISEL